MRNSPITKIPTPSGGHKGTSASPTAADLGETNLPSRGGVSLPSWMVLGTIAVGSTYFLWGGLKHLPGDPLGSQSPVPRQPPPPTSPLSAEGRTPSAPPAPTVAKTREQLTREALATGFTIVGDYIQGTAVLENTTVFSRPSVDVSNLQGVQKTIDAFKGELSKLRSGHLVLSEIEASLKALDAGMAKEPQAQLNLATQFRETLEAAYRNGSDTGLAHVIFRLGKDAREGQAKSPVVSTLPPRALAPAAKDTHAPASQSKEPLMADLAPWRTQINSQLANFRRLVEKHSGMLKEKGLGEPVAERLDSALNIRATFRGYAERFKAIAKSLPEDSNDYRSAKAFEKLCTTAVLAFNESPQLGVGYFKIVFDY